MRLLVMFGIGLVGAILPQAAAAKAPVNVWLCKVLKQTPFDPVAAIGAFPLEKLPAAVEERKEKTGDDGTKRTSVVVSAEGQSYSVRYSYQYRNDNVSDPYGFDLTVRADYPASDKLDADGEIWLAEFGKPERSSMGRAVFAGPEMFKGGDPVFRFEKWSLGGTYGAHWWSRGDIRYSADLCK